MRNLDREEICAIEGKFRAVTHSIGNWLTVMKALVTMREQNPGAFESLLALKASQSPLIVARLQELAVEFELHEKVCTPEPAPAAPAAPAGSKTAAA